jgi:hypothetical protein
MSSPSKVQPSQAAIPDRHCWGDKRLGWEGSSKVLPGSGTFTVRSMCQPATLDKTFNEAQKKWI